MIYVWVYYIKIYDPIKFSSNLWVCPGAINTCSHYERQVTSDRKNERILLYNIYSLLLTLYIFIFTFSLFFRPFSQICIIFFYRCHYLYCLLCFIRLVFIETSKAAVAWRRISSRLWHSDKNEAISVVFFSSIYVYTRSRCIGYTLSLKCHFHGDRKRTYCESTNIPSAAALLLPYICIYTLYIHT